MLGYVLRRLLWFVPMLLLITLFAFGLRQLIPGDPVQKRMSEQRTVFEGDYLREARLLELDLPTFYFSVTPTAVPDTLHRIFPLYRRLALRELVGRFGNWSAVAAFDNALLTFGQQLSGAEKSEVARQVLIDVRNLFFSIRERSDPGVLESKIERLGMTIQQDTLAQRLLQQPYQQVVVAFQEMRQSPTIYKNYIPTFHWYGFDNQYHRWLKGFMRGDFGLSYDTKRPVASIISNGIYWTLLLTLCAFLVAFALGIPLGVLAALKAGGWQDRLLSGVSFFFFSMPRFWVATLMVTFLTTDYYVDWLNLFPTASLKLPKPGASLGDQIALLGPQLILPVTCLVYPMLAFIIRQMRRSMLDVLQQDFIRTARSKGLSERKIIWKHAFRNAIFPIITMIAGLFPAAVAGSIVIEIIFDIPGMGLITFEAIFDEDWPIVLAVLVLSAFLTLLGILVSDILYTLADPRVNFQKREEV